VAVDASGDVYFYADAQIIHVGRDGQLREKLGLANGPRAAIGKPIRNSMVKTTAQGGDSLAPSRRPALFVRAGATSLEGSWSFAGTALARAS